MSVSRMVLLLCLLLSIQTGADSIFEVDRFDRGPDRLVVHRDPFSSPSEQSGISSLESESTQAASGRMEMEESRDSVAAVDPEPLMSRRISYEGYTRKEGRYFFLLRVDGEFFIGNAGITIAGNIRIIGGDNERVSLEIEGEEVEIQIRDLVQ